MTLSTKITLIGLAAAIALAISLGGREGAGVFAGFTAGASLALASALSQRRIAHARPELVLHLIGAAFVAKIFVLLGLTLLVRFVEPIAASLESHAFVLAFAAAVLALLPVTTIEFVRLVGGERERQSANAGNPGPALRQGTLP